MYVHIIADSMDMKRQIKVLRKMGACSEALDWLSARPSWGVAWTVCPRSDWMLWLLIRLLKTPAREYKLAKVWADYEAVRFPITHAGDTTRAHAIATGIVRKHFPKPPKI